MDSAEEDEDLDPDKLTDEQNESVARLMGQFDSLPTYGIVLGQEVRPWGGISCKELTPSEEETYEEESCTIFACELIQKRSDNVSLGNDALDGEDEFIRANFMRTDICVGFPYHTKANLGDFGHGDEMIPVHMVVDSLSNDALDSVREQRTARIKARAQEVGQRSQTSIAHTMKAAKLLLCEVAERLAVSR